VGAYRGRRVIRNDRTDELGDLATEEFRRLGLSVIEFIQHMVKTAEASIPQKVPSIP